LRTVPSVTGPAATTASASTGAAGDGALRTNAAAVPIFTGLVTLGSDSTVFNNATAGSPTSPIIRGGIATGGNEITFTSLNSSGNWIVDTNPISGTGSVKMSGAGALTLANANTFSGTTRAVAGTVNVNDSLALQNSTLDMNAADAGAVSFGTANATLGGLTGTRNLPGPSTSLAVGNNNCNTSYGGVLSGTGTLTKIGSGILTLTGANTYGSANTTSTTITAGTLLVSNTTGSGTGPGNVLVSGGTLGGTGSISGTVTVDGGGTLSPGASIESLATGTLTFNATTLAASNLKYEIAANGTGDVVNAAGGSLNIADASNTLGTQLNIDGGNAYIPTGNKYTVVIYDGKVDGSGWNGKKFANDIGGYVYMAGTFPRQFLIKYNDTSAGTNFATESAAALTANANTRFVTLVAVPELDSFLTVGLVGCFAIGAFRFGKRIGLGALNILG